MKTLDELYKEVSENEDLKKEYASLKSEEEINNFLKANDCDATASDVQAFLNKGGEITDDELDNVAGGTCYKNGRPVVTAFNNCWEFKRDPSVKGYTQPVCCDCAFSKYEGGLLICYNDARLEN